MSASHRAGLALHCVLMTAACAAPGAYPADIAAPEAVVPRHIEPALAPSPAAEPPSPDAGATWRLPTSNGAFFLEIVPVPDPVAVQQPFRLRLSVHDADGLPEPGARVQLNAWMPEHGHDMARRPRLRAVGDGEYLAEGLLFTMRGRWELIISIFSGAQSGQARLVLEV